MTVRRAINGPADPRLRLALVVITLQVLGQTALGFKLSIAQILISILVCAGVEIGVTYWRRQAFIWPASAILTGNSTALLLRATGTRHGDWLSLNGIQFFVFAALVGILSKYLVRLGARHLYNPSNLGLVVCFLIAGAGHVFPQYLWWGPTNPAVLAAWAVILVGAVWVLRPLRMWSMVLGFLIPFAALIGVFSAQDQCFYAAWRASPVCASNYWLGIVASPELFIFVLLMMSDPKTSPQSPSKRVLYGAATACVAAALIYPQASEFGVKVALLSSLTIVCTFVPLMERWRSGRDVAARAFSGVGSAILELRRPTTLIPAVAVLAITVAVPVDVVILAGDQQVINIDRHPSTGVFGLQ